VQFCADADIGAKITADNATQSAAMAELSLAGCLWGRRSEFLPTQLNISSMVVSVADQKPKKVHGHTVCAPSPEVVKRPQKNSKTKPGNTIASPAPATILHSSYPDNQLRAQICVRNSQSGRKTLPKGTTRE
jgi:hypothetical protein